VSLPEFLLRFATSVVPNLALGIIGYLGRAFDRSGLVVGVILASLITYSFGWGGFAAVACFVVPASIVTRVASRWRAAGGAVEPSAGVPRERARTWRNALANLAVPAFAALIALLTPAPVLGMFITASVATAAFDTVASEMGRTFGRTTVTLNDMKVKAPGTPGGVSVVGTVSGGVAALAIALVALGFHLVGVRFVGYVVVSALLAGASESLLKSVVGFTSPHAGNVINTLLGGLFGALFWTGASTI
jgi:uncharacterized protein (TIGR00297 family)